MPANATNTNHRARRAAELALSLAVITAAACESGPTQPHAAPEGAPNAALVAARSSDIIAVPLFVRTATGPVDPATTPAGTPLYEIRAGEPLLAPDGHQITWGEFSAVTGSISVQCLRSGTHIVLHLSGLIPNGVYTLWNATYGPPGFDGTLVGGMPNNLTGVGAAGPSDGSRNSFRASANGTASVSVISAAGPLSAMGSIGHCGLTDEYEWHVVGLYHMDGQTYGPSLGPDGTMAEQFGFMFKR